MSTDDNVANVHYVYLVVADYRRKMSHLHVHNYVKESRTQKTWTS